MHNPHLHAHPRRLFHRSAATLIALTALWPTVLAPAAVAQSPQAPDPALVQTVDRNETIIPSGTPYAMTAGHFDLGVVVDEHGMHLLVRDDSQHPPVWRDPNDVVFVLDDHAKQTLPDDGYGFVGAPAGAEVYAIPQNQISDVPWLGWNTQAPSFLDTGAQGLTLQIDSHQGNGEFSMFVQSGGFAAPDVLVDANRALPQGLWVEMNTHVHANWVFTQPGAHTLGISALPDIPGGNVAPIRSTLRFAVGDTNPQDVLALPAAPTAVPGDAAGGDSPAGAGVKPGAESGADSAAAADASASDGGNAGLWMSALFAGGALLLVIALVVWARGRAAQRAAKQQMGEE